MDIYQFVDRLNTTGGCIVSSDQCSSMEIADAQARGDFYVDGNGHGYVRRLHEWLQKHSRFATGATDSCEQSASH